MKHTLIECLLSRIPKVDLYPSKYKKESKPFPNYLFVSTRVRDVRHPVTGVVSQMVVGFTYRKE